MDVGTHHGDGMQPQVQGAEARVANANVLLNVKFVGFDMRDRQSHVCTLDR